MIKKRLTADHVLSHLKKIGATNWDQESINDMLCILQCKGTIYDNFTLAGSDEDASNQEDIDILISPVISDSENLYSISSPLLAVHQTTTPSLNLEKLRVTQIATPTVSASSSDFSTSQ